MNNLLQLAENYDKNQHLKSLIRSEDNIMKNLTLIFDPAWKTNREDAPMEVISFLLDSYYVMPERPDLASLFMWQAINRLYSEISEKNIGNNGKRPGDLAGIIHFINDIDRNWNRFYSYMQPYYDMLPEKIYRFVGNYIINGILAEDENAKRFAPLAYNTLNGKTVKDNLTTKFQDLIEGIRGSFACAEKQYTDPRVENDKFVKNKQTETKQDKEKLRLISMNLAHKLKELVAKGSMNIQLKDTANTNKTITFTEKERFGFMLIGVLYASRCNNLHGNVEARMNSEYADKETFMTYTDIYLLEYMITAIGLVMNGQMDEKYLVDLKNNCQLLIR